MKPLAIFRHVVNEGPGFLAEFFDAHAISWQLIAIDAGDAVPLSSDDYSGLVFMGGPMSVNDDLPWITAELDLIFDAVANDVPVLGHCLGGQLIAKALGGVVSRNGVKELGWAAVQIAGNETARVWFGEVTSFDAFHWHGETFTLPPGATHLLSSEHCLNQAFSIGKHLAFQCHIEMTDEMVANWCEVGADEIAASLNSPAVQTADEMQQQGETKLPRLHRVAEHLYSHWIIGLRI